MYALITDRSQQNVSYRNTLAQKGWRGMTSSEREEWLGDPMVATGANLLPYGPQYSSSVTLKYRSDSITATANYGGIYLYAVSIIGEASQYEGKTFTLSVDHVEVTGGGLPQLAMYWHDDTGFEYAGASLFTAGSVTFDTRQFPNTAGRGYLAMYVYVTTSETVETGASVRFDKVMLEIGTVRHPHVPYTEILPTVATKGAYNFSDLNRVERAVSEISEIVGLGLITKTTWTMWDVPTSSEMTRYLSNIELIRSFFDINVEIPTTMNKLTYADANNIELVLQAAYGAINE